MNNTYTYWPTEILKDLPKSPISILRDASGELVKVTSGALEGHVTKNEEADFYGVNRFDFVIESKALNYRHGVFYIEFDPVLQYPVHVYPPEQNAIMANNHDELQSIVVGVLSSEYVLRLIRSLYAQSMDL